MSPTARGHSHAAGPHEAGVGHRWRLALLAVAMAGIAAAEAVGGWITGSLALLADAAHALTDVLSLGLALFASYLVSRAVASPGKTFGYHRAEILAAFANAVLLGVLAVFVVIEAVERLVEPRPVDGLQLSLFAVVILGVETVGALVLYRVQGESLNLKAAFLHLLGDLASTGGVVVVGLVIHFGGTGFLWADPLVSILIAGILGYWAYALIGASSHILMEGTPGHLDTAAIRRAVREMAGVRDVHDLHVWTLTTGLHSMSAHIVADHPDPEPALGHRVRTRMQADFGLGHVTIQVEDPAHPCDEPHA